MKIEDMRKDRTVTIEEILPGCVFEWLDEMFMATDIIDDVKKTRLCVCIGNGRTTKFLPDTTVSLVDAKAVVR